MKKARIDNNLEAIGKAPRPRRKYIKPAIAEEDVFATCSLACPPNASPSLCPDAGKAS
jgi:hypothetical protein